MIKSTKPNQPAFGLAIGSFIFFVQGTIYTLLFARQLIRGEQPVIAWAIGSAFGFTVGVILLYWWANFRGPEKARFGLRQGLLTCALFLATGGAIFYALWVIAGGNFAI